MYFFFFFQRNKTEIASTKIPYKFFKNLTLDESLKYFNNDQNWENYKLNYDFDIKNFQIKPFHSANISINSRKKKNMEKAVAAE